MAHAVLVSVRTDAYFAASDQQWMGQSVDFTRLPFVVGDRWVNADVPYLSEEALPQPFQRAGFVMRAGVHLHWALPDALCHGVMTHAPDGASITTFPAVPNRWLVIRGRRHGDGAVRREAAWVVESDYLWPDGEGAESGSIAYPFVPDRAAGHVHPFRHLGRVLPIEAWLGRSARGEYLDRLTCVGYGEPSFAALYPNCHSVFGFHDPDIDADGMNGLSYQLIGWYSDLANDVVRWGPPASGDDSDAGAHPRGDVGTIFQSRVEFAPESDLENADRNGPVTLSVGNSAGEAIAAALSAVYASGHETTGVNEVEEQLNALQLGAHLDHLDADLAAKFREARHTAGFSPLQGGVLWSIRPVAADALPQSEATDSAPAPTTGELPAEFAHALNRLNELQQGYERLLAHAESAGQQLFADWCKYMIVSAQRGAEPAGHSTAPGSATPDADPIDSDSGYPHAGDIADFITNNELSLLRDLRRAAGELSVERDDHGAVHGARTSSATTASSVARELAREIDDLVRVLRASGQTEAPRFHLVAKPGPRWWQPREPVVLIHGRAARATGRHGRSHVGDALTPDGSVRVFGPVDIQMRESWQTVPDAIDALDLTGVDDPRKHSGVTIWRGQPWHPIMLSWKVAVVAKLENSDVGGYSSEALTSAYVLADDDCELIRRDVVPGDMALRAEPGAETILRGTTMLTPLASHTLHQKIRSWLITQLQASGFLAREYAGRSVAELSHHHELVGVLEHYERIEAPVPSAMAVYIWAYRELHHPHWDVLAQSLGGFNEALLMRKQTFQLPVASAPGAPPDPLTDRVAAALAGQAALAPLPTNEFVPIRSGELQLLRLQLIDTFGQTRDVLDVGGAGRQNAATVTARALRSAAIGTQPRVHLPPRIVQPARLDFRWLSADHDDVEMNDHPASSPVCGWILANFLDNSLWVYDNGGVALGLIDQRGAWQTAPGRTDSFAPHDIANRWLRRTVGYLLDRGSDFQQQFISTIDTSLAQIEPAGHAHHSARSLLVGRPMALVRARLGVSLRGAPAARLSWRSLGAELAGAPRRTDRFEQVSIPIRLGEHGQLDDGLVGFWAEEDDRYRDDTFFSPLGDPGLHPLIRTRGDDSSAMLHASLHDSPQTVTMLIDPRGSVHATCGVLPTKSISLPHDQTAAALAAIEIAFFTAPLLTEADRVRLPLPADPGARWSWLEHQSDSWHELAAVAAVSADRAVWPGRVVLRDGWLALRSNGTSDARDINDTNKETSA